MTKFFKSVGLASLAGLLGLTALAPMPAAAQPYPYYRHEYYRPYYRPYYRHYDPGAAIAGTIVGGMFGAIAGAAIRGNGHVARCERAYRSYVPATDSYTGYDGLRHRCLL